MTTAEWIAVVIVLVGCVYVGGLIFATPYLIGKGIEALWRKYGKKKF